MQHPTSYAIMCYTANIKAYIKQSKTVSWNYFFMQLILLLLKTILVETLINANENIIFIYTR